MLYPERLQMAAFEKVMGEMKVALIESATKEVGEKISKQLEQNLTKFYEKVMVDIKVMVKEEIKNAGREEGSN